jgi:kinesin family member 18/19
LQLLRAERQRRLCEDIIISQRRLIEGMDIREENFLQLSLTIFFCCLDGKVDISDELKELYSVYQQEIHASAFSTGSSSQRPSSRFSYDTKLPPIYNRK